MNFLHYHCPVSSVQCPVSSPRGGGSSEKEISKVELLTSNESDNDQEDRDEEEDEKEADDIKDYDQQDSGLLLHHCWH